MEVNGGPWHHTNPEYCPLCKCGHFTSWNCSQIVLNHVTFTNVSYQFHDFDTSRAVWCAYKLIQWLKSTSFINFFSVKETSIKCTSPTLHPRICHWLSQQSNMLSIIQHSRALSKRTYFRHIVTCGFARAHDHPSRQVTWRMIRPNSDRLQKATSQRRNGGEDVTHPAVQLSTCSTDISCRRIRTIELPPVYTEIIFYIPNPIYTTVSLCKTRENVIIIISYFKW